MWLKYLLIGLMIFMLGGCTYTTSIKRAQWLAGDGYPDDYYEGYAAGCDSGLRKADRTTRAYRIDGNKYVFNKFYKSGWDDGLDRCYNDEIETNRKADEMDRQWREYKLQKALDKYLNENNK